MFKRELIECSNLRQRDQLITPQFRHAPHQVSNRCERLLFARANQGSAGFLAEPTRVAQTQTQSEVLGRRSSVVGHIAIGHWPFAIVRIAKLPATADEN